MKKLLSLVLVLLMVLGIVACGTTTPAETPTSAATQAPAAEKPVEQPTAVPQEPEAPKATYVALGLNIKNKTGATIDEVYIYPVGGDKGNSVVAPGWQDKDADKANYEKNIYIVREAGAAQELLVVFADGTEVKKDLGELKMYTKISMKGGADPAAWEVELEDKAEDKAAMDAAVAVGKTADNVYPGYELLAIELKNKTGKNIVDFRFFEQGGDANAYNNIIDYLYTANGEKMASLMPGKAKEGGMYLYKCFIRPHADSYNVYVKFEDGSEITYPIEDWFKPDGDGHLPNEISLKNAEDKYDIKVQYDDGDPDPLQYLALSLEKGYIVDQWYPVYEGAPAGDAAAVEAARVELAKIPVPAPEVPAGEPAAVPAPMGEPVKDDAAPVSAGYVGLALNIKNKTGKTINEVYIYAKDGDKGASVVEAGWKDKDADKANYEKNIYIFREAGKEFELYVVFEDGTDLTVDLGALDMYDKISMQADKVKHEPNDDPADIALMDEVVKAGVTADGWYPAA